MSLNERRCRDCQTYKHLDCFSKNKRDKMGYQLICKLCMKQRAQKYRLKSTIVRNLSTKICSACKLELPRTSFYKRYCSSTHCVPRCKSCTSKFKKDVYRRTQVTINGFKFAYYSLRTQCNVRNNRTTSF